MRFQKSSRHAKITGDFGETLVLYLLSKTGFECARIDHTGIDLIARRPDSREVMGISVKSRSRSIGSEGTSINIRKEDIEKAQLACKAFGCKTYFAIVVDEKGLIRVFILTAAQLVKLRPGGAKISSWAMTDKELRRYRDNKNVMWIEMGMHEGRWW